MITFCPLLGLLQPFLMPLEEFFGVTCVMDMDIEIVWRLWASARRYYIWHSISFSLEANLSLQFGFGESSFAFVPTLFYFQLQPLNASEPSKFKLLFSLYKMQISLIALVPRICYHYTFTLDCITPHINITFISKKIVSIFIATRVSWYRGRKNWYFVWLV